VRRCSVSATEGEGAGVRPHEGPKLSAVAGGVGGDKGGGEAEVKGIRLEEALLGRLDEEEVGGGMRGSKEGSRGARRVLVSTLKMAGAVVRGAKMAASEPVEHATMRVGGSEKAVEILLQPLREVVDVLVDITEWQCAREVKAELQIVAEKARNAASGGCEPLALYAAAPVPIVQYNPRFDDEFNPEHNLDVDRERAQRATLKRQGRKELKGAMRELRKDNHFLGVEKSELRQKQRTLRDERAKAIETFLTQQQFEAKLGAGKKKRKRR
jgi:hypothetical protein